MAPQYQVMKPTAIAAPVSRNFLTYNKHDRVARAFFAADLYSGATQLVRPTKVQASFLAGVNRTYTHWAIQRSNERAAIEAGIVPLVPAPSVVPKMDGRMLPASISGQIPDHDLIDFVRVVGVNRVLEAAVAVEATQ